MVKDYRGNTKEKIGVILFANEFKVKKFLEIYWMWKCWTSTLTFVKVTLL